MTKARIVLFGDPQGVPQVRAALGVEAQVVALVQASTRPGQGLEMRALADAMQVPLMLQPSAKEDGYAAFVERLTILEPDFMIVNSYSMILRPSVLAAARRMSVNVHGALLPQYRGANVTEWALIGGENESGVTAHVVDTGIDTGPVLAQKKVPLYFTDTWLDARARINTATEQLLVELLPRLIAGDAQSWPQGEGSYWHRRKAEDGAFSWRWPLRRIYNLVRALVAPHPGAKPDDPAGVPITKWTSLPALARRKFEAIGAWDVGGVMLTPHEVTDGNDRVQANAQFDFDVAFRDGAKRGAVSLFPDYAAKKALARFSDESASVAAAIAAFCQTELGIAELAVGT